MYLKRPNKQLSAFLHLPIFSPILALVGGGGRGENLSGVTFFLFINSKVKTVDFSALKGTVIGRVSFPLMDPILTFKMNSLVCCLVDGYKGLYFSREKVWWGLLIFA